MKGNNAIVLCSGGLDSVITAHYVKKHLKYKKITILFFNYGQKSINAERRSSKKCAKDLKADFREIKLPELQKLSTSLINVNKKSKKLTRKDLKDTKKESAKWYVPMRNTIFLSYALALAENLLIKNKIKNDIFLGFKNEGSESYPDTTEKYVREMNGLSKITSNGKFAIKTPLIKKDKEDIINLGIKLKVDLSKTHSCYVSNLHCGTCLACMLRKEGFRWAGVRDSTRYKA